jgi:hypothetical protein
MPEPLTMSPVASTDTDEPTEMFLGEEPSHVMATLMMVGGWILIAGAIGLFAVALILPPEIQPNATAIQFMVTGPIIVGIALIGLGRTQRGCPAQVDVGPTELVVHHLKGKQTIAWREITRLETGERSTAMGHKTLQTLKLFGTAKRPIMELDSQLQPFDTLVALIRSRAGLVDPAAVVDTTPRKKRREAWLLVTIGPLFVALAFFVGLDAQREIRQQTALRESGQAVVATVVKHEMFHVTPRLEYEFRDAAGRNHTRNTMVETRVWQGLKVGAPVNVRYVPDDPAYSRLLEGDADDASNHDPRLMLIVAPLCGGMGVLFALAGALMFRGLDVDAWVNRTLGIKPKRRGRK